jgi:hypothetical protein
LAPAGAGKANKLSKATHFTLAFDVIDTASTQCLVRLNSTDSVTVMPTALTLLGLTGNNRQAQAFNIGCHRAVIGLI